MTSPDHPTKPRIQAWPLGIFLWMCVVVAVQAAFIYTAVRVQAADPIVSDYVDGPR